MFKGMKKVLKKQELFFSNFFKEMGQEMVKGIKQGLF